MENRGVSIGGGKGRRAGVGTPPFLQCAVAVSMRTEERGKEGGLIVCVCVGGHGRGGVGASEREGRGGWRREGDRRGGERES